MYAFAIRGEGAERALRRLLPELDGRVAAVRVESGTATTDGGVATARPDTEYVLGDGWRATGDDSGDGLSVMEALDRLAPDHEYAVVLGDDGAATDLPTVVVDDADADGLVAAAEPEALDVEQVVDAVDDTEAYETLESLVAAVKRSSKADYAGAIATFTGRVRPKEHPDDERTRYLEFEKYEGVAERRMRRIETDLAERDGVLDVRLHHRTGRVHEGEDIVFVVVLAGHRGEAFRTVEDGIDRLKDEVPLFKKEVTEGETFWVHERETE